MIAVLFEVTLRPGAMERYRAIAADLTRHLATVDGFISVERFQSLSVPDRLLSLSFWRDEAAIAAWRRDTDHAAAQAEGRAGLFTDYTLHIAGVLRHYTMADGPRGQRHRPPVVSHRRARFPPQELGIGSRPGFRRPG